MNFFTQFLKILVAKTLILSLNSYVFPIEKIAVFGVAYVVAYALFEYVEKKFLKKNIVLEKMESLVLIGISLFFGEVVAVFLVSGRVRLFRAAVDAFVRFSVLFLQEFCFTTFKPVWKKVFSEEIGALIKCFITQDDLRYKAVIAGEEAFLVSLFNVIGNGDESENTHRSRKSSYSSRGD